MEINQNNLNKSKLDSLFIKNDYPSKPDMYYNPPDIDKYQNMSKIEDRVFSMTYNDHLDKIDNEL